MPLLEFVKTKYRCDTDEHGTFKYHKEIIYNGIIPYKSFFKQMKIKKSNKIFDCHCCEKERGKGTRYVGDNWYRVCQFCMNDWMNNSKKSFDKMKEAITEQQNLLKQNKTKWGKEAIVSNL